MPGEAPAMLAERLARQKAETVAVGLGAGHVVLGSDTVVSVDGELLGKPTDRADANRMISRLHGRTHEVTTGVAVVDGTGTRAAVAMTTVTFRVMSTQEIEAYVASGEGDDKAGAYGIQGLAGRFVERIDGSYHNVVGLPLTLVELLLSDGDGRAWVPDG